MNDCVIHLLKDPGCLMKEAGSELQVSRGRALPFGLRCRGDAVNFSIPCRRATMMSLILADPQSGEELIQLDLGTRLHRSGDIWHVAISGLNLPLRYAWRLTAKTDRPPAVGQPELPDRRVLDPWAIAVLPQSTKAGAAWQGLFPLPEYHWQNPAPPRRSMDETIIYETHLRGFTRHASSGVSQPGSYAGLIEKIPYLKDLGITAVELLPIMEFNHRDNPRKNPDNGEPLVNYWGYDPLGFFAPKASYSSGGGPLGATVEFRRMVDELHGAGIELILDVVFNHTGERSDAEHSMHFRLLDNRLWYMVDERGYYRDYSGCGNSLNCNHPLVRSYVMDCLRFWVAEMGVDGFRFDLASILGRDAQGKVLDNPPVLEAIAHDPLLSNTKIIAEAWDAAGLYQVGSFPSWGRWAEWNGQYRDTIRRLLRGDPGMVAEAATRLTGSADLYRSSGRTPLHSINFITAHDGFTLADLNTYSHKHNRANGEENRDGSNSEHSTNWGHEGPDDCPERQALRLRQQRNALALLFLSQGVPMLLAGDEFGRSQQGNNNPWCQDNEISWLDWELCQHNAELLAFTRSLIALRRQHPVLRRGQFFQDGPNSDIRWHGVHPGQPDFSEHSHSLAFELRGRRMAARLGLEQQQACDFYLAFNFWNESLQFQLPTPTAGGKWSKLFCTTEVCPARITPNPDAILASDKIVLQPYSLILLAQ